MLLIRGSAGGTTLTGTLYTGERAPSAGAYPTRVCDTVYGGCAPEANAGGTDDSD